MEVDYKVHEFVILFAEKDTIDSQNINNKFGVKYYLNLFLVDEEDRCYIKQQEMMLYRLKKETFLMFTERKEQIRIFQNFLKRFS
ncbi:hypothetical protein BRARA_F01814 [Brassica rapa]|uniref:Uncharacterized protein n=1 Tax=Brassica campestris TaxID=3711 RepID=A0A397Z0V1_BRACM|nr:hypothetical protein BRARA_F01814 [Brassica rapa]